MNVVIASKLVDLRKANGLSQEALAERIGVSRQAVSKWERAESSPDTDNLIALSKLYNMSLDDMLSEKENVDVSQTYTEKPADSSKNGKRVSLLKVIPYPIIVTIVYLFIGVVWGWWNPGWLLFLTIPIWGAIVSYTTKKKDASEN